MCPNVGPGYQQKQQHQQQQKLASQLTLSTAVWVAAFNNMNSNLPLELFEASPYNIMTDSVICEQFRKLYEEDEYFQNI